MCCGFSCSLQNATVKIQGSSQIGKRNGSEATVSAKQILHTINNQLTIVIGKAALLASETEDLGLKKRCEEIETAAHNISRLLDRLRAGE